MKVGAMIETEEVVKIQRGIHKDVAAIDVEGDGERRRAKGTRALQMKAPSIEGIVPELGKSSGALSAVYVYVTNSYPSVQTLWGNDVADNLFERDGLRSE